jgi:predicted ATPase
MEHNHPLTVWGRQLLVPECAAKVARFPFMRLCGEALSSADYLEITQNFDVVFVEKMPVLGKGRKDLVSPPSVGGAAGGELMTR